MIKNGYYYPEEALQALTHRDPQTGKIVGNAQVALSFGNRSAGKTVGWGIAMIKQYLQYGERFCLLTRTQEDLKAGYLQKWLGGKLLSINDSDGILQNFKSGHEIKYYTDRVEIDGDPICYGAPISLSSKVKDAYFFDHCSNIILDEAVQIGERYLNLGSPARPAMSRIMEIYQTIARGWENAENLTHLIFIANTSERDNWIFNDLDINAFVKPDTKRTCQNGIYVEIINNKAVAAKVSDSIIGSVMRRSISGRAYYEAAQNNAFLDNKAFVKPIGLDFKNLKLQIFTSNSRYLGVFRYGDSWHIAAINKDKRSPIITLDAGLSTEEIEYAPESPWLAALTDAYVRQYMTFGTQEAKGLFLNWCGLEG